MAHITFIHGICNKPAAPDLLREWCVSPGGNDGASACEHCSACPRIGVEVGR